MPAPMRSPVKVAAEYRGSSAIRELSPVKQHPSFRVRVHTHTTTRWHFRIVVRRKEPYQYIQTRTITWLPVSRCVCDHFVVCVHHHRDRVVSAGEGSGLGFSGEVLERAHPLVPARLLEGLLQL